MNIFKVLASYNKSFPEEQTSVFLAWLLNPYMEHGLGFVFLKKFISKISDNAELKEKQKEELSKLMDKLETVLRTNENINNLDYSSDIEFNVETAVIDIVIFIENYLFSIENKIYTKSIQDTDQLMKQYEGLKTLYNVEKYEMFIIFLVPTENKDTPDDICSNTKKTYNNLSVRDNDCKAIIEWSDISKIINEIIDEDNKGIITPINEYIRHTLKAFLNFISNDFQGYGFETENDKSGINPLAKGRKNFEQIKEDDKVKYIGVKSGISGLLKMKEEDLSKYKFQFSTGEELANKPNWIKRNIFLLLCNSIINKKFERINEWIELVGSLSSETIYFICKHTEESFYIGIQGGLKNLKEMTEEEIKGKQWKVSTKEKSKHWISKEEYIIIYKKKVDNRDSQDLI